MAETTHTALIKEIKENFDYCRLYWEPIYDKGREDIKLVAGDPWPAAERRARKEADRLCLSLDEWNQYVNQCINEVRQNKRAIKVIPKRKGATAESAEMRAGIIRGIEYECKATRAYIRGFENLVQRSFGFWKVNVDFESPDSFHRVLKIVAIPNPETIYIDPDAKEPDGEDMSFAFELDSMPERTFVEKYPDAEIRSFTPEHMASAPSWITQTESGKRIQVAGYWKVKRTQRTKLHLANDTVEDLENLPGAKLEKGEGNSAMVIFQNGGRLPVIDYRKTEKRTVCQHVTNGLEILEEIPWGGSSIPIVVLLGKELYVNEGGQTKRVIESYVRHAHEPALAYCYARTCQTELVGMAPKTPYEGYEGQFATNTQFETLNKTLVPYVEFKATTPASGDSNVLPLPQKNTWEPPIQALELLAVGAKQAIQASMGIGGLISGARGQNMSAKSGVALKELDQQESQGTFHFIDALNWGIERTGRIIDEQLSTVYDLPREVSVLKKNDDPAVLAINQPGKHPETGEDVNFSTSQGDHGITISEGPSYQSQHEEVSEFADHLVANAAVLGPEAAPKVVAFAIRMKDLGPEGDELADQISPQANKDGEQNSPIVQGLQNQLQQAQAVAMDLKTQLDQKLPEIASKERMQKAELDFKRDELEMKTRVELAKIDSAEGLHHESLASAEGVSGLKEELGAMKHERQITAASEASEADRAHQIEMQDKQQQGTLEQQQQAAELAPVGAE